jgi:hypothetical protein
VILRLPAERRERPSIEAVARLAPSRSLVDSLIVEVGTAAHDAWRVDWSGPVGIGREEIHVFVEFGEGNCETDFR